MCVAVAPGTRLQKSLPLLLVIIQQERKKEGQETWPSQDLNPAELSKHTADAKTRQTKMNKGDLKKKKETPTKNN